MMWRAFPTALALALAPLAAMAESVVAVRTIPAQSVLTEADLTLVDATIDGALTGISQAVGRELKTTVYAGRPISAANLTAPALVERNQTVGLVYQAGALIILAEGRALARGGEGDVIRAMNLVSKTTVSGRIAADGRLYVGVDN
ncbi:MAG: flagellar basal body P-ring formation chaperone FlgA [Paracoccaceae bacterium]